MRDDYPAQVARIGSATAAARVDAAKEPRLGIGWAALQEWIAIVSDTPVGQPKEKRSAEALLLVWSSPGQGRRLPAFGRGVLGGQRASDHAGQTARSSRRESRRRASPVDGTFNTSCNRSFLHIRQETERGALHGRRQARTALKRALQRHGDLTRTGVNGDG